jgi:hypothetical protein
MNKFSDEIPTISVSPGNFEEQIQAAIADIGKKNVLATRDRPYDGQPQTAMGGRGKTLAQGLTMRDISDCFVKGLLLAQPPSEGDFLECWDFSTGEAVATPYLLAKIAEMPTPSGYLARKAELNLWTYGDVYHISEDYDPLAAIQNAMCEIEKMMGIYPNVSLLEHEVD